MLHLFWLQELLWASFSYQKGYIYYYILQSYV